MIATKRTIAAGRAAVEIPKDGVLKEKLLLSRKEQQCLTRIDEALDGFPKNETTLMRNLEPQCESLYDKASYDL
jgi:hypothetical protein